MKRLMLGPFPCFVAVCILIETVLRHLLAGSSIVASILSSSTSDPSGDLLLAMLYVCVRFFVLWILPALTVTWLAAKAWRAGQ